MTAGEEKKHLIIMGDPGNRVPVDRNGDALDFPDADAKYSNEAWTLGIWSGKVWDPIRGYASARDAVRAWHSYPIDQYARRLAAVTAQHRIKE